MKVRHLLGNTQIFFFLSEYVLVIDYSTVQNYCKLRRISSKKKLRNFASDKTAAKFWLMSGICCFTVGKISRARRKSETKVHGA